MTMHGLPGTIDDLADPRAEMRQRADRMRLAYRCWRTERGPTYETMRLTEKL